MNDVLSYFRERDPGFKSVPDNELSEYIYNRFPEFLKDPGFRADIKSQFATAAQIPVGTPDFVSDEALQRGRLSSAGQSALRGGGVGTGGAVSFLGRAIENLAPYFAGMDPSGQGLAIPEMDQAQAAYTEQQRKAALTPVQREIEVQQNPVYQAGRSITEGAREAFQPNPKYAGEFFTDVIPSSAGGMIPTFAAAMIAGPAGGMLQYGGSSAEQSAEDAIKAGRIDLANRAAALRFPVAAISEGLLGAGTRFGSRLLRPTEAVAGRTASEVAASAEQRLLQQELDMLAKGAGRRMAEVGAREAAQESIEQLGENVIASSLAPYDPNRPLMQGVAESAAAGFLLGGGVGGVEVGINAANRRLAESQYNTAYQDLLNQLAVRSVDRGDVGAVYGAPFQETVDTSGTQVSPEGGIGQTYKGVGVPFRAARPNNAAARRAAIEAGMYSEPTPDVVVEPRRAGPIETTGAAGDVLSTSGVTSPIDEAILSGRIQRSELPPINPEIQKLFDAAQSELNAIESDPNQDTVRRDELLSVSPRIIQLLNRRIEAAIGANVVDRRVDPLIDLSARLDRFVTATSEQNRLTAAAMANVREESQRRSNSESALLQARQDAAAALQRAPDEQLAALEAAQASRYGAATRPIAPEPRPTLGMSPEVAQRLRDLRAQEQRQLQQINEATVQVPEARQPAVQEGGQGAQGTGRVDRQAEVREGQVPADVAGRAEVAAPAPAPIPVEKPEDVARSNFIDQVDGAAANLESPARLRSLAKKALQLGYITKADHDEVLSVQKELGGREDTADAFDELLSSLNRNIPAPTPAPAVSAPAQPSASAAPQPAPKAAQTAVASKQAAQDRDRSNFISVVEDAENNLESPSRLKTLTKKALEFGYITKADHDEVLRVQKEVGSRDDTSDAFSELVSSLRINAQGVAAAPEAYVSRTVFAPPAPKTPAAAPAPAAPAPVAQTTIVYADGSTIQDGDFVQLKSSVFGPLKEGKPLGKTKIAGPASINQDGSLTIQLQVVGAESETKKSAERKTKVTNAEANGISLGDRLTFTSIPDGGVRVERVNADGKKRGETVVLKKGKNPFTKTEAPVAEEQESETSDKLTPAQEGALASLQTFESSPKYQRYMSLLNRTRTGSESEEEKAERQAFENDLTREERIFLSASFQILEGPKQIAITLSRNYPGLLIDDTKISKMWTKRVLQSIVRRLQNPEQSANLLVKKAQSQLILDYIGWASTDPLSKTAAPTRQTDEGGETEALGGIGVGAFERSPMSETGVPSTVGGIDVGASIGGRGDAFNLNSSLSEKLTNYAAAAERNNLGRPVNKVVFRQVFDRALSEVEEKDIRLALGRASLNPDIRQQLFNEGFEKAWDVYSKTGTDGLGYIADQYESNSEEPFEFLSRNVGPATGLTVAAVEDRLLSRFGIQAGGLVRVVNDPNANFDGRIFISKADGRIVRIEINSAKVSSAADIDRVLLHEESEAANANGELAAEISQVTPDEAAEIAAEVARLEYDPAAVSREEDARKVELLAKAWRGRNWFQRITGRVLAWANSKGVRLTRLAAEYIAAKAVAKVHARVSRPSTTYTVNGNEVVETLYSKTPFKTRAQVESETRRPGLEQSQVTTIEQSASVQRGILPAGLGAQLAGLSQDAERGMRWLKSLNEISTTSIPLSSINPNDPNKGIFSYAVWNQNKNILDILAKKNAKLEALREQMTSPRTISMLAEAVAAKSAAQVAETAQRALLKDYSKYIRDELRTFAGVDAALEQAKVNATNAALYIKKQNADVSKAIDIISDAVPDSVIAASKAAGNNDAIIKYVVDNNVLVGKVLPETIAKLLTPPASGKRSVLESYRRLASSLRAIKDYKANLDLAAADRKAFEDYFALASTSPAAKSKKVSIEDFAKRYYRERSTKEAELERLKALNLEIERIDNEFAATLEQIALLESVVASPEFKDSYATATKNLGYSNPEILGTVDPRGRGERWVVDGQEYFFNPQLDVAADTNAGIDFYKLVSAVQARLQQLASGTVAVDPVELESLQRLSERLRNYGAQTASPALTAGWLNPFVLGRRIPGVKALVNRMALARLIPGPMGKRLSLLNAIQDSLEKKLSAVKANKFFGAQALKVAQYRAIQSHPGMDPMVWREEVANELLNSRQNDRDPAIKVGEATPFGHVVTKEDLAAIELMARFSDQVYAVTSGDFVGGVIKYFPTLIREGNRLRRAFAAGAATTPRRLLKEIYAGSPSFYVQKVLDAVNSIKDENAQLKAIEAIFDDPTAFSKVLRRYVAETNSDFENTSNYAKIYEQLAIRWRKNPASLPTTTDELVSQIADMSPAAASMSDIESDIKRSLLDEVRKFSIAIDQEKLVSQQEARNYIDQSSNGSISGGSDASPTAIVSVVDGLNQFTKPRGKMVAPGVFYSYTLSTDAEINGLLVAAQIPSMIQIARQMMDVESALKQYIVNMGERMRTDPDSLKADIKSGKFYIDRSKAETLLSLVQTLRDTFTQRVQGINVHDDSGLLGQVGLAQKILLLTTPMVPITNYLFGVAGGDVVARSMTRGLSFKSYPRAMASALLTAGTKPVLRLVERAIVTNPTLSAIMRKNRRAFGVFAERFIRVSDEYARVAQIAKLGGWEPETVSPFESAKLISEMGTYGNVVRQPGDVESASSRAIDKMFSNRAVASLREFMMSMQPKADELANTEITRTLQKHLAVMFMAGERMMQIRSKSGNPGWDNWANPDNVITPQEAFENAGWTPEQLIMLKDMLVPAGSIEFLMADYHKRVEAARNAGQDIYSVPLIADQNAEADVLMRGLAASNLPIDSARADIIKTRGGFGRAIRFLIGFPGWMGNWLGTLEGLSSISTERKDKVIAGAIQLAALVALLLLLMLAGIPANEAKGVAYGLITGRPYSQTTFRDVLSDPSAKNISKLGAVAIAGMVPYWGEIAAGLVGAQKNRADLTDLTKLSPQLGAISTLSRSLKYATATGDYAGAVLSAVRGTLPVLSPALNRIPSVAARDAVSDAVRVASRNAGSLELKTSGGGAGMEPTQFSSLIRRAVAASAAGDNAGAQQLLNRAAEVKAATGVSDPWSAVKASLKSQFPEQKAFGRMLSSDEKIGLRSRMSPEQRAVFDRGDVAIQKLVDGIKPKSERAGGMPAAMRRIRALTRGPKALRMIKTKIKQLRPKKLRLTRSGRTGSVLPSLRSPQMAALGRASRAQRRRVGSMSPLGRGYALGMPAASIGI